MYRINVDGGVKLAVHDLNPRGRKVILFVHGWPLCREIFEYQYNVLPKYDVRCISVDLRGYGQSDKPLRGYSYDRMSDDLHKLIQSLDCKNITLCGFSMGGAICLRYMARHCGYRVCKLVLMGAACPIFTQNAGNPTGMTKAQVDTLIDQCYTDRPAMCDSFGKTCFASGPSQPFLRWFSGLAYQAAGHATIQGLVALRDENLTMDMGKISVPTAIFHGVHDQVCPFAMAQQMNEGIRNSMLVPFQKSGHCLFYDEKERCNQLLLEFVNQV